MAVLFNTSVSFVNACYIIVNPAAGTIALGLNSGVGSTSKLFPSGTLLSNSQCSVGAATLTISGLSYILTVALTFPSTFGGVPEHLHARFGKRHEHHLVGADGNLYRRLRGQSRYASSPLSGTVGVSLTASLNWDAVAGATSYDVYFGDILSAALRREPDGHDLQPGDTG